MYDNPGQLCQPSHKSRMADHVLFEKEIDFLYDFCVGHELVDLRVSTWIVVSELDIYFEVQIYIYM